MPAPILHDYRSLSERRFGAAGLETIGGGRPKVTLITVTLNACATLERTIASVRAQTFADLEHVVVEGASSDGTRDLLQAAMRAQDYWISEPDRGISDAFNKGVALASGDYIQFINADDWLSDRQVAVAFHGLESNTADFVFGDLIFYRQGRPSFRFVGDPAYHKSIHRGMPALNHPTVLIRRDAFERIGLFDLRYRCAMDYDWFLRLHLAGGRGIYLPGLVGHMNHDGVSNNQYWRTFREVEAIAVAHGRHRGVARLETSLRLLKTGISRQLRGPAQPLYRAIRKTINQSYKPLYAPHASVPGISTGRPR